ncbi:serine acetyltransferase [uncultured Mucilaginibacter sp.]|uniref:serine O-acetyltransferase n=1 Tax=uncultured Mucilaginibacter sp. TaxID=797541 RepID=UPI0025F60BAE|nr:serine acetyltransferase [uncultured Mucilaginibacter sp.]
MATLKLIKQDLNYLKDRFNVSFVSAILTNRGFHAVLLYRISHSLFHKRIPIIPLVLTRIVQITYAIDIDFKATLHGGIIIIHGVGLVIGQGAVIHERCILYHGVTLGRRKQIVELTNDDGFPTVGADCVLGAGCKIIGKVNVGHNSLIGPNVVLTHDAPINSIVKCHEPLITVKTTKTL